MDKKDRKEVQVEVILDILELKNHSLISQSISMQRDLILQNNAFPSTLDSLVSHFMDKYQLSYKDLEEVSRKRDCADEA